MLADELAGQIVRARGVCVTCPAIVGLEWAHGLPRTCRATRWDLRNGFCQCHECHEYFTRRPREWRRWREWAWGAELTAELEAKARANERVDLGPTVAMLRAAQTTGADEGMDLHRRIVAIGAGYLRV